MYQIDDLLLFMSVVENTSFRKTSIAFGVTPTTVSRRIKQLVEDLKYELFVYDGHNIKPTAFGQELYNIIKHNSNYFDNLKSSVDELVHSTSENAGQLKLKLPLLLSEIYFTPFIAEFIEIYPNINLDIIYDMDPVDFETDPYDVVIVTHTPTKQNQKFVKLLDYRLNLYCTREYARKYGIPNTPQELQHHRYVNMHWMKKPLQQVEFTNEKDNTVETINLSSRLVLNSNKHALILAKSNNVIFHYPENHLSKEEKELFIQILPDYRINIPNIFYMIKNPYKDNSAINLFTNFIKRKISTLSRP